MGKIKNQYLSHLHVGHMAAPRSNADPTNSVHGDRKMNRKCMNDSPFPAECPVVIHCNWLAAINDSLSWISISYHSLWNVLQYRILMAWQAGKCGSFIKNRRKTLKPFAYSFCRHAGHHTIGTCAHSRMPSWMKFVCCVAVAVAAVAAAASLPHARTAYIYIKFNQPCGE